MFSFFFFLRINKTSGQAHQEEKREDPNKPTKKPKNTSAHCTITVISVCLSRQTLSIDGNTTEPNIHTVSKSLPIDHLPMTKEKKESFKLRIKADIT